jgi:hypothetical protein
MLVILLAGASRAPAAPTPGPVGVRVEGASATLIPSTLVATQPGVFSPIADHAHTCSGTSAAEALELASLSHATGWTGTYFAGFGDYLVTSIAGELHPSGPTDGSYWALWYDHRPASTGICSTAMNPNDEVLFFPDCASFAGATCPPGFVSPNVLGMTAPTVAQTGTPVSVGVTTYAAADGAASPAANATVSGGGATASTTVAGAAALTFTAVGTFILQATAPNSVRSETHTICVHDGNDGNCGTPAPPGTTPPPGTSSPPAPCLHHGDDGLCGTTDRTPPRGHLTIAEGTRFRHGHGPRTLTGRIESDPSGLRDVVLRITRIVTRGRCEAYNASRRKFARTGCGIARAPSFSVGRGLAFSYLLPAALSRGRYTVEVEATDGAGNHDAPAPARNRIVFRVE